MALFIVNGTLAATDVAQNAIPADNGQTMVVLTIEGGGSGASVRFNVGADATTSLGELIVAPANGVASATISLFGQRISVIGPISTPYSVRQA